MATAKKVEIEEVNVQNICEFVVDGQTGRKMKIIE